MELRIQCSNQRMYLVADDTSSPIQLGERRVVDDWAITVRQAQAPYDAHGRPRVNIIIQDPHDGWRIRQYARVLTTTDRRLTLDPNRPIDPVGEFVREQLEPIVAAPGQIQIYDQPDWAWAEVLVQYTDIVTDGAVQRQTIEESRQQVYVTKPTWLALHTCIPNRSPELIRLYVGPGAESPLSKLGVYLPTLT
jgi:hypothetical protein